MRHLLVFCFATCLLAQQTRVQLDTQATKVTFTLADVLHTVHGTFQLTNGDFWFDPTSCKAGGTLTVNGASGNSGSHARDSRMSKNVLQADLYPQITFAPDHFDGKVNLSGHSEFQLHGTFTIHGGSHELTMHVKTDIKGDRLTATADFSVPYVEWGMKNPSTLFLRVSEAVPIEVNAIGAISSQ